KAVIHGGWRPFALVLREREHVRWAVFATVRLVERLDEGVIREQDAQLVLLSPEVTEHALCDASHLARPEGDGRAGFATHEPRHACGAEMCPRPRFRRNVARPRAPASRRDGLTGSGREGLRGCQGRAARAPCVPPAADGGDGLEILLGDGPETE